MSHHSAAFEQQLNALLDGELNSDEADAIREHLAACDECRALHERLASARDVLRSTPAPAVPPGLLASIRSEAEAEMMRTAGGSIWGRWRVSIAAVAAAAAVLLAVFTPWQALREDETCEVCPPTEQPAVVAESPAMGADELQPGDGDESGPAQIADAGAAGEDAADDAAPGDASPVTGAPRPRRAAVPDASPQPTGVDDEGESEAVQPEPAPVVEPAPHAQPQLASAPRVAQPSTTATRPVLSEAGAPMVVALGPRTATGGEATLEPAVPAALETELASGVVAGMVLDQFVAEHMVESSSTMLAVVTETPTSELGPVVAEEEAEAGSFGFSFTDAMRQALAESENQLP